MSALGAQDLIAGLAVATAGGWLVWRRVRPRRGRAAGACPDCPVAAPHPGIRRPPMPVVKPTREGTARLAATPRPPLIQLTPYRPRRDPGR